MKKVLIIRFSSIGDIVLTSPVIRCLKQQIKGIEVHYLTKEQYKPILEANPYIDKIITIDKNRGITSLISDLRAERYDYIVDLHKNMRSWRVILSLFKPFGTFSKLNIRKFLICKLKLNFLPGIHIADRYFHAVKKLKVTNDGQGLDYFIPGGTDPWNKMPELPRDGFIALVIGGKHATKQLPSERLHELCRQFTLPVILLGGKEDEETGNSLQQKGKVFNTCGNLSLHESAAVIRAAGLVVTHDTGLMHIAAALKKDIVSVWGNTIPEFGMYPYLPEEYSGHSEILEVKGLSCRPCSKLGYKKCPRGHFKCMMEIDLQKIKDPDRVSTLTGSTP